MQNSSWGGRVVMDYQARPEGPGQVDGVPAATMAAMLAILPVHGLPVARVSRPRRSPLLGRLIWRSRPVCEAKARLVTMEVPGMRSRLRDLEDVDLAGLAAKVGNRLLHVQAPLRACVADPGSPDAEAALASLRNPWAIEDDPAAFHTTGWHRSHVSAHSPWVVAAESAADIAAAVDFARGHGAGVVIKGTGHDYLGRSCAPGSLMIWTHRMREVTVHDGFVPAGSPAGTAGIPAITVGAGARWLEAYQALLPSGRYVQGGGCVTVGAAGGFVQGGGFGSLSRRYGTAAGNVLEAEVVLASGEIVTANALLRPDLFWALRGGGGGTFGVVSKLTMRTYPAPRTLGRVTGTITAASDADFRRLLGRLALILPALCDDHWGEHVAFTVTNVAEFGLQAGDLPDERLQALWRPFLDWVSGQPGAYRCDLTARTGLFDVWDHEARSRRAPDSLRHDDRPGAPPGRFWNAANQLEVSWYLHAYGSRWLPRLLLDTPDALADVLFRASRPGGIRLDFNKALSGAAASALDRDRATAINPAVFEAAALAICASWEERAYPGVPGHEPDAKLAEAGRQFVSEVMDIIRAVAPAAGSYVNETDYHEPDWQRSFWGDNYARLLEIKRAYDPGNLFRVHHGVGSDD
jgi:FAD/FMN-containing dehydrogenase